MASKHGTPQQCAVLGVPDLLLDPVPRQRNGHGNVSGRDGVLVVLLLQEKPETARTFVDRDPPLPAAALPGVQGQSGFIATGIADEESLRYTRKSG